MSRSGCTPAQGLLFDALRAFAASHVDVGYCQGMNFVAAAIICVHNNAVAGPGLHHCTLKADSGECQVVNSDSILTCTAASGVVQGGGREEGQGQDAWTVKGPVWVVCGW